MNAREKMKNALRERGFSHKQIHDVELLSQGFKPEGELDLTAVWQAQKFLLSDNDRMESSINNLTATCKTTEAQVTELGHEVAALKMNNAALEMSNNGLSNEIAECQRLLSNERAKAEYYRQKTDVNSFAMKIMDRVYMPVYNFFNMPDVKMLPLKVMGNMPVSGDVNVQGDMIEKQYLKGWK